MNRKLDTVINVLFLAVELRSYAARLAERWSRSKYGDGRDIYMKKYPKIKDIHFGCPGNGRMVPQLPTKFDVVGSIVAAHTHTSKKDPNYHHICLAHKVFMTDKIMAHEYAHVLIDDFALTYQDHGDKFWETFESLGFKRYLYYNESFNVDLFK